MAPKSIRDVIIRSELIKHAASTHKLPSADIRSIDSRTAKESSLVAIDIVNLQNALETSNRCRLKLCIFTCLQLLTGSSLSGAVLERERRAYSNR